MTPTVRLLTLAITAGLVAGTGYFLLAADPPRLHLPLFLAAVFGAVVSAYVVVRRPPDPG